MKKKILVILLALAMILGLAACGSSSQQSTSSSSSSSSSQSSSSGGSQSTGPKEFVFETGGKTVRIDEDMADVLADLGKEKSYFEAASCAFEGLDKTYTYSGFAITTRPDGDKDYVQSILLSDDSVTTPEGLYIGCSKDDVLKMYGDGGEETLGGITYTLGGTVLSIVFDKDTVISIEYLAA